MRNIYESAKAETIKLEQERRRINTDRQGRYCPRKQRRHKNRLSKLCCRLHNLYDFLEIIENPADFPEYLNIDGITMDPMVVFMIAYQGSC